MLIGTYCANPMGGLIIHGGLPSVANLDVIRDSKNDSRPPFFSEAALPDQSAIEVGEEFGQEGSGGGAHPNFAGLA